MTEEKPKKKKCPTALKRMKQSKERNLHNRSFKARVRTAIRSFKGAESKKEKEKMQEALSTIFSLMDKGVKSGIFKQNKAARTKSQLTLAMQKSA